MAEDGGNQLVRKVVTSKEQAEEVVRTCMARKLNARRDRMDGKRPQGREQELWILLEKKEFM